MAKLFVLCVYDSAVKSFDAPFVVNSIRDGKDMFSRVCNNPDLAMCRHPNDFSLMSLGTFDTENGRFENLVAPENLGLATAFKAKPDSVLPLFPEASASS